MSYDVNRGNWPGAGATAATSVRVPGSLAVLGGYENATGDAARMAPARANRAPGGAGLIEDYLGPHAHPDPALPN